MHTLTSAARFGLALAVPATGLALNWVLAEPNALTPLTYVVFAGLGAVVLITNKKAHAAVTGAQLLHAAESPHRPRRLTLQRARPRVQRQA